MGCVYCLFIVVLRMLCAMFNARCVVMLAYAMPCQAMPSKYSQLPNLSIVLTSICYIARKILILTRRRVLEMAVAIPFEYHAA